MFLFKKIVSQLFFPIPLSLSVCFTGLALLWWTRRQRTGKVLVSVGLLLLTALSYGFVADALLMPLEGKYSPFTSKSGERAEFVVVLGGGHRSDTRLPLTSQISDVTLKRLVEGIRVHRETPGSKIVLSGGHWLDPVSDAEIMSQIAAIAGTPAVDIVLEKSSKDTSEEARLLRPLLGTNRFILVTSATHMPRSVALFKAQGMHPIPAPAEHLVAKQPWSPGTFFPSSVALGRTERAFYEYLGLAWMALKPAD